MGSNQAALDETPRTMRESRRVGNSAEIHFQQQVGLLPTPEPADDGQPESETTEQVARQQSPTADTDANKDTLLSVLD